MTTPVAYTVDNGYITLPITVDPDDLMANALDDIAAALPGWQPSTWLPEA